MARQIKKWQAKKFFGAPLEDAPGQKKPGVTPGLGPSGSASASDQPEAEGSSAASAALAPAGATTGGAFTVVALRRRVFSGTTP